MLAFQDEQLLPQSLVLEEGALARIEPACEQATSCGLCRTAFSVAHRVGDRSLKLDWFERVGSAAYARRVRLCMIPMGTFVHSGVACKSRIIIAYI